MPKKNNPGCGCCGGGTPVECDVFSDDYNRSDDTDIGVDYDELSGSAAIVSNQLVMSSSGTVVRVASPSPTGTHMYISCQFTLSSGSAKMRLYVGDPGASGYLYADFSENTITIGQDGGSSVSHDDLDVPASTLLTASLCWDGNTLSARCNDHAFIQDVTEPPTSYFGIGAPNATVTVDNLIVQSIGDGCPTCPFIPREVQCTVCGPGFPAPPPPPLTTYWYVVISGCGGDCADCASIDGVYFLTFDYRGTCQALTSFPTGDPCTADGANPSWSLFMNWGYSGGVSSVTMTIGAGGGSSGYDTALWNYEQSGYMACDTIDAIVVTYNPALNPFPRQPCCTLGTMTLYRYDP